ncbi:hypothetical protein [Peribacillus frigoritolerans]|uniref:hypothetical protein n=1 Tax=Peribacillus frigoritolerans TaxID=450367 RepID=UPI00222E3C94|nr:hypothetical protein [Peribacillus frigoritolerans]MDM5309264.1 hypothetical protein [Peribacillus frigoritolerans]UZD49039.1 hypothetical protein OMJ04_11505 [Peribacillus frigoritolerans]WHX64105.1 hypothetical protein QNH33_11360 [Peribacillus frigoritolerans]
MVTIIACIGLAMAVIGGLFKINLWSTSKEEVARETVINEIGKEAIHSPDKSELVPEETLTASAGQVKHMNDQAYRQALQCFQDTTQEDLNIKGLAMKDEEYRKALKTMNRKRDNEKNREVQKDS